MRRIFTISIMIVWMSAAISYGGIEIDKIVAIVNNEPIALSEVEKIVSTESKEILKDLSGDKKAKAEERLRKEVLKELIERRLQLQAAKRLGIAVSKEDMNGAIEDIKKKNSIVDDASFEKALAMENMTRKEYESQLKDQMIMAKLLNQEVRSKVVIGDKDVASYYENNKKDYFLADQVKISHIFLKLSETADEKEKDDIKVAVNKILGKLKSGADFGEMAKNFSRGPTASSGGSLGPFKKGEIAPELEKIALSLKEGEISDPIWTSGGVHILKIDEAVGAKYKPLEDVREEIRKLLSEKEMDKRYREWINSLRANAFIEIRL